MATINTHESSLNVSTSRAVRDVGKGIAYVDPDEAPLTVILMKAKNGTRTATNKKVEWIEKNMYPELGDQINEAAGYTAGDTTITVDNGERFAVGDLVKVMRTEEVLYVTAISSDDLTVTRSVGDASGTAAAAMVDNDDVLIIGNAQEEGASVGTPKSHDETYVHNFLQIFRTPFGTTGSEAEIENYTGPDRPRLRREKAREHRRLMERALLFGERSGNLGGGNNDPAYAAGGLLYYLTSNNKTSVGTLTEAEIEDWAEDVFQRTGTSNSRLWVAGPKTITIVDLLASARLKTVPKEDTFGVSIKQFVTGHGTFNIVKHRELVDGANGDGFEGLSFALDMSKIKYVHLRNRDTKLLTDRQAPGDDKWTDEYLTEASFQIENPVNHGTLEGVTG